MYKTIHDLPFHIFRDVMVDGDFSLLGEGADAALWEDLLMQYAEAIGEKDTDGYLKTRRELLYYESQRFLVDAYLNVLSDFYIKKWADALGKIVQLQLTWNGDKEAWLTQLERARKRSIGLVDFHLRNLRRKMEEHEKKQEEKGDTLKPSREFFAKVLINLHEYSNWQFNDNEITTFQYCEIVKRYSQHISYLEEMKTKNQPHARR